ncbi:MAG: hypothetical protein IJD81_02495 [Oscillospiraceae bacterium]|nr:hypothetical protein [Oscillospiraceae bacterium]
MVPVITPILAILLPVIVLYRSNHDRPVRHAYLYSVGSFASALTAVCLEILTIRQRVLSGDFGGIEDTIGAVVMICIAIAAITILLNLLAMAAAYSEGASKQDSPL